MKGYWTLETQQRAHPSQGQQGFIRRTNATGPNCRHRPKFLTIGGKIDQPSHKLPLVHAASFKLGNSVRGDRFKTLAMAERTSFGGFHLPLMMRVTSKVSTSNPRSRKARARSRCVTPSSTIRAFNTNLRSVIVFLLPFQNMPLLYSTTIL
jgi:hypothetical protein